MCLFRMNLPKYAIHNYQFAVVLFILISIAGIFSFFSMPRTENPAIYIPGGSVVVVYPGANPNDLENLVAVPIEESINEMDDIRQMNTSIKDGFVTVGVEFDFDTDAKAKYDEMVTRVNSVKNQLPKDIYSMETFQYTSSDVNILQLAVVADSTEYNVLEDIAGNIKEDLEKISGMRGVEILACPEREIRVSFDPDKMSLMNITLDQVAGAIKGSNANIPGGSIRVGDRSFNIKTSGAYKNLEEIENTVVHSFNGRLIYLKNIAKVEFAYADTDYIGRYNGRRGIFIVARQKEDFNLFDITDEIYPVVEGYKNDLPDDIEIHYVFDQKEIVESRINGFLKNLLQGILLVGIIILLSLGIRSALIVIFAIPLSIVIGLWFVDLSGFGLQQISIAGLVVALGLLVDNSIVIIENINRFMGQGLSGKEAAVKGAGQIAGPVIAATVTTILAFIPLIMMPDKAGDFIESLPVTIIATLLVSLLIALTITPLAAGRILSPWKENKKTGFGSYLSRIIEGPYRKSLDYALKHSVLTVTVSVFILVVSIIAFRFVGISFFPKAELPQFLIRAELPEGTDIHKTDAIARQIEAVLDTIPRVKKYASNVGHGNPRIYYNTFPKSNSKNFAEFFVGLEEYDVEEFDRLIGSLRKTFSDFPGTRINIKEFEQGIPIQAPIEIHILGDDSEILQRISRDIEKIVAEAEGSLNIQNQLDRVQTDLFFDINKDKAAMLGVPAYEIDKTIRTSINGMTVSKYRDKEGEEYDIVMRLPYDEKISLGDLDRVNVASLTGCQIPLKQLVTLGFRESPGLVTRYNMKRNATILADIEKDYTLDDVLQPIIEKLSAYRFPAGYSYHIAGELENREESYGGMTRAILLAMIAIFAVLVLQFRSFIKPWIIFAAIPLAFIGSVWAWLITGNTFSFTAFVGLISLVGIVVNNAIILVDYTNKLIDSGMSRLEALKQAGETRFTPIILTSLTTVGGLLPLTLGGGTLWAPMGWGIIGGLLTSTFLTLIVVPVMYNLFCVDERT